MKKEHLRSLIRDHFKKILLEAEATDLSPEIQALIDKNALLKGTTPEDIIEGNKFVLIFSDKSAKHIAERHMDKTKPGSLFKSGANLKDIAKKLLNMSPSVQEGGRVKWLGVNGGSAVGEMGVAKGTPEQVANMKDYTMPDGNKETVKIAPGKRIPTNEVSLITVELGDLSNGKKVLSAITMFPGGTKVDGVEIPMDRGELAAKGLYFVVDPSSPLLEGKRANMKSKLKAAIKEEIRKTLKLEDNNIDLSQLSQGYASSAYGMSSDIGEAWTSPEKIKTDISKFMELIYETPGLGPNGVLKIATIITQAVDSEVAKYKNAPPRY